MPSLLRSAAFATCVILPGCGLRVGEQPPLVSANSPPNANGGANEMPQTINSLPPGAEGIGPGPNATVPSLATVTFGARPR